MKKIHILVPTLLNTCTLPLASMVACGDPDIVQHTITWKCNIAGVASFEPATIRVKDGVSFGNVEKPAITLQQGYRRVGQKWYFNQTCTEEVTSESIITADVDIYANFEQIPKRTLTWKASNTTDIIDTQSTQEYDGTLIKDAIVPVFEVTSGEERVNDKLYSNKECTAEIKQDEKITRDMDIFAKFGFMKTITWDANLPEAIESTDPKTIKFEIGTALKDVPAPHYQLNEGYNRADDFWYSDPECTVPINPNTIMSEDMHIYAKFESTPHPVSISINEGDKATATIGYELPFACTIKPRTTDEKDIRWISFNEDVATISETGVLTPHKAGTVMIAAWCASDPTKYDLCEVTVEDYTGLCFEKDGTEEDSDPTICYTISGSLDLDIEYRFNNGNWQKWNLNSETNESEVLTINDNDKLYVRNNKQNLSKPSNYFSFKMTGKIKASGNVNSLVNDKKEIDKFEFAKLFNGCASLTQAPKLPSTSLGNSCYDHMFYKCSSLIESPELPATQIPFSCYYCMFHECTSLINAPDLPANELVDGYEYSNMFANCTSLIQPPELPATKVSDNSYYSMFNDCNSLTSAPELPATQLAYQCYNTMFYNCKNLKIVQTQSDKSHLIFTMPFVSGDCVNNMFTNTKDHQTPWTPEFAKTYYWMEQ